MSEKISKERADYREHTPRVSRRCGTCSMFRAPDRCTLVKGLINRGGVCKFWEPKR